MRNSLLVFPSSILYSDRASVTYYFITFLTSQSLGPVADSTIELVPALSIYHNSFDQQVLNPPWHPSYISTLYCLATVAGK